MGLQPKSEISPEKSGESIIRIVFYGLLLLLLWDDFLTVLPPLRPLKVMTYPVEKVIFGAFVVCSWLVWSRLSIKFAVPKFRSGAGFLSLLAGTASFLPYAVLVFSMILTTPHRSFLSRDLWGLYISAMSLAVICLSFSFFGKGKIRIAGMTVGLLLMVKWAGICMSLKETGRWPSL